MKIIKVQAYIEKEFNIDDKLNVILYQENVKYINHENINYNVLNSKKYRNLFSYTIPKIKSIKVMI